MLALATLAAAGEVAVLRNGFSIQHERREVMGASTRLYMAGDAGYVDVPTAEIISFEPDGATVPTPAPSGTFTAGNSGTQTTDPVSAASGRTGLDPALISSVIRAESGFNPRAVSRKGAQGLMQLMPQTASQLGVKNAFDPQANVQGGSEYLRQLLARYHNDLPRALAAYNAGPERVERYGGMPPFQDTYAYVSRVIRDFNRAKRAQISPRHAQNRRAPRAPNQQPASTVSTARSPQIRTSESDK